MVPRPLRGRRAGLGQTHPVSGLPSPGVLDAQHLPSRSLFPLGQWRAPTPPLPSAPPATLGAGDGSEEAPSWLQLAPRWGRGRTLLSGAAYDGQTAVSARTDGSAPLRPADGRLSPADAGAEGAEGAVRPGWGAAVDSQGGPG